MELDGLERAWEIFGLNKLPGLILDSVFFLRILVVCRVFAASKNGAEWPPVYCEGCVLNSPRNTRKSDLLIFCFSNTKSLGQSKHKTQRFDIY